MNGMLIYRIRNQIFFIVVCPISNCMIIVRIFYDGTKDICSDCKHLDLIASVSNKNNYWLFFSQKMNSFDVIGMTSLLESLDDDVYVVYIKETQVVNDKFDIARIDIELIGTEIEMIKIRNTLFTVLPIVRWEASTNAGYVWNVSMYCGISRYKDMVFLPKGILKKYEELIDGFKVKDIITYD